jgi:hypothetical protein
MDVENGKPAPTKVWKRKTGARRDPGASNMIQSDEKDWMNLNRVKKPTQEESS